MPAKDITNIGKAYALYKWGQSDESCLFLARAYVSGTGTRDPVAGEPRSDDTLTQGLEVDLLGEDTAIIGKVCSDVMDAPTQRGQFHT
ncbi:TPA: hypothetical protein RUX41_004171 [Aeromonas dhakensis]|nr:hypothetical protein [Aeromonas dhakensis]